MPKSDCGACLSKRNFLSDTPVFINRLPASVSFSPENTVKHMHAHEFIELSIVMAGKGIHCIQSQTVECHVGDVYVVNVGTPHAYFAAEDGQVPMICNVIFDPQDILDAPYAAPDSPEYCYNLFRDNRSFAYVWLTNQNVANVEQTLALMEKERFHRRYGWEQIVKAHLVTLLVTISRYSSSPELPDSEKHRAHEYQIAQRIMRYVMNHFNDPDLQLQGIARGLNVSSAHAGRVFRNVVGSTFSDYIWRIRLERACQLLAESRMTNEQIVYACGLRDTPTFYRQFKEYTGMTPRAYRIHKRSENLTE